MEEFFNQISNLLQGVFALAEGGFDGVNQVLGLIIAGVAGLFLMHGWRRLWAMALGAAFVHILIQAVRPVLDGGAFRLPDLLTLGFWMSVFALFLGYAIVIAVFYFIKTLLTGGHKARHAH
ncbi:MAG: hypothetical protein V4707_02765 [Pseudomonadota bacterium]